MSSWMLEYSAQLQLLCEETWTQKIVQMYRDAQIQLLKQFYFYIRSHQLIKRFLVNLMKLCHLDLPNERLCFKESCFSAHP